MSQPNFKDAVLQLVLKTIQSRKFWAAVAASIPFAIAKDWANFSAVWMVYTGIQGAVDFRQSQPPRPNPGLTTSPSEGSQEVK
jgi:hypothetical protein